MFIYKLKCFTMKKNYLHLFFYLVFIVFFIALLPMGLLAQETGTLYGKVYDQQSGQPLIGAVIKIKDTDFAITTTTTDAGSFELKNLPVGRQFMSVSHHGYDIEELTVLVSEGERRLVDVYLEPAPYILKKVIVKDRYVRDIPYMHHTLKKEEIEMMAVRDIGDQLRMLPNVGGIKKGAINIDPVVRGFKYSQITTLMDGAIAIEGGCPNRMDPTTAHISLDDMAEMQVYKGPFALRYGAIFGGVVNLIPVRPMPSDFFEINVKGIRAYESNWNANREYASVSGGNRNVFFLFSGYNQKGGNYTDGNGNVYRTAYHKFGYKASVGARLFGNHEALLSFSNSGSRGIMFAALPMDDRIDDSRVIYFDYKTGKINEVINSLDFKIYTTLVDHTMDNRQRPFGDTVIAIAHIIAETRGARLEAGLNLFGGHLYLGADQRTIDKDGDRVKTMIMQNPMAGKVPVKVEQLWNNARIDNLGLFAEFKRRHKNIDFIGTARIDFNQAISDTIQLFGMGAPPPVLIEIGDTESEHVGFSASLGATYNFDEKLSISIAAGRGTRFPDMLERFIISLPVGFDRFEYMGNPQLQPEINNEVDLNAKYIHPNIGGFDITYFYSYVQNFIMGERIPPAIQRPLTDAVFGVKRFENFETGIFQGFEFAYRSPEKYDWGIAASASYTHSIIHNTIKPIIDPAQPPLQSVIGEEIVARDPAPEIPPFEANISLRYRLFHNKIIPTLSCRVVAAQNHVSDAYLEDPTEGFTIFNANIAYIHNQYLSLSLGINNIFDIAYYEHLNRRVIGSRANFYEPGRVFYVNAIVNI